MPMIAITTNSSTSVNARRPAIDDVQRFMCPTPSRSKSSRQLLLNSQECSCFQLHSCECHAFHSRGAQTTHAAANLRLMPTQQKPPSKCSSAPELRSYT